MLPAAVAGRLRAARARRAAEHYPRRVVEHRYAGATFRVVIGTPYGERYDADWADLPELAVLRGSRLQPGARVLNLGANHGVIALMLADAVGRQGQVVALEADPHNASLAIETSRLNDLPQLTCLHGAVARASGSLDFSVAGRVDDGSGRLGRVGVPAWSIDDLAEVHGPPDVVFMDVEGYEAEGLAGAARTLEHRPDWFVEIHGDQDLGDYGASVDDVLAYFDREKYALLAGSGTLMRGPDGVVIETATFAPLQEPPPRGRFFLIALAR
jgi:FkbM family methyltransferase